MAAPNRLEDGRKPSQVVGEPRDLAAIARDIINWRTDVTLRAEAFMGRERVAGSTLGNPHMTSLRSRIKLIDFTSEVFGKKATSVTEVPRGLTRFLETSTHLTFLPTDMHDLGRFQEGTLEVDVEMPFGLHTKGFVTPQVGGEYRGEFFQVMPDGSYIDIGGAHDFSLRELADTAARPRKIY